MKLDKSIKDSKLVERLDKIDPDNASGSKNDGINYWKGKKIVSLAKWKKMFARSYLDYQKDLEVLNKKEALQYFPDDYEGSLFPLTVPEELMDLTDEWTNRFHELMEFRNNSKFGRQKCSTCLLCPDRENDGNHLGLKGLVARIIEVRNEEKEGDDNFGPPTPPTTQSLYPCSVLNRFKCPYDREEMEKKPTHQPQVTNEDSISYVIDYLFTLGAFSSIVELAIINATKENSVVPIKNLEDIYNALTDRETLDKVLQQELEGELLKYKDGMIELFMSIKESIRMEDLTFYKPRHI